MKKIIYFLFVSVIGFASFAQKALPSWPLVLNPHGNTNEAPSPPLTPTHYGLQNLLLDWRTGPVVKIPIPGTASYNFGPSSVAYDNCGNVAFYAVHSGLYLSSTNTDSLQLKIFSPTGVELSNDPGNTHLRRLDCSPADAEVQMINVPGYTSRWILVYNKNNHPYELSSALYSVVELNGSGQLVFVNDPISGNPIVDKNLNPSAKYFYSKSLSKLYPYPVASGSPTDNRRYLYLKRNSNANANSTSPALNDSCTIDQFYINASGLSATHVSVATPVINQWTQSNAIPPLELNEYVAPSHTYPTLIKLAFVCSDFTGSTIGYLQFSDHEHFSTATKEAIPAAALAVCPSSNSQDYIGNYTPAGAGPYYKCPVNFSNYLVNFANKLSNIEFSPSGDYLYTTEGGYPHEEGSNYVAGSGYDFVTYLGQIDLQHKVQTVSSGNPYQYLLRMKVQKASLPGEYTDPANSNSASYPGYYSYGYGVNYVVSSTNTGVTQSPFLDWHDVTNIETAYNGKLYLTKRNSDTLFCLSNPDSVFRSLDYRPGDVLANDPGNIKMPGQTVVANSTPPYTYTTVACDISLLPDGVDGENYLSSSGSCVACCSGSLQITRSSPAGPGGLTCSNTAINFSLTATCTSSLTYLWDFGDGSPVQMGSGPTSHSYALAGTYYVSVSVYGSSCSISGTQLAVSVVNCCCDNPNITVQPAPPYCNNSMLSFYNSCDTGLTATTYTYAWDFGDGMTSTSLVGSHAYTNPGTYVVSLSASSIYCTSFTTTATVNINLCPEVSCTNCIGSFAPEPGDYMVSVWVREDRSTPVLSYTNTGIGITFTGASPTYSFYPDVQANPIIDGWQRIEQKFNVPAGATAINISLLNQNTSVDAYFDDIRIHPFNGNMKSYVYDPVTLRLTAELDENNYATIYEYDEEGKLIRVKKETERGIMTIKETRSSNKKQ